MPAKGPARIFGMLARVALGLASGCAGAPSPAPSVPRTPPSIEAAMPDLQEEPCASTPLCVDRAEAQIDVDPQAAEAQLHTCLACPEASPAGYRLLADLLRGRGDRGEERRVLLEARRRFPDSASILLALGRLERDEGRPRAAVAVLREAHRKHPRDEIIAGEYEALLARFGTESEQRRVRVEPLLREAAGRYELEDVDGARQTLLGALDVADGAPCVEQVVLHRLGLLELSVGNLEGATAHVDRALVSCADHPDVQAQLLLLRGEVHLASGEPEAAIRVLEQANQLEPSDPLGWANLAVALATAGRIDEALDAFAAAVDRGLARRLTYEQLMGLGEPILRLEDDARFQAIVTRGWPGVAQARGK